MRYYKGKPYSIVAESKIKLEGIWDVVREDGDTMYECDMSYMPEWANVVIYKSELDGRIWVRFKEEFYKLFKEENETRIK